MNEDYLWDKSGEPDPQIQELEEILAPLRYQPKPLIITPKRNYLPLLAIAATVVIALLAAGLWLRVRTDQTIPPLPQQQAQSVPSVYKETPDAPKETVAVVPRRRRQKQNFNRQEALAAKEQLMMALRLASEKLKSAQRITQGASPTQIKNQHKSDKRS